MKKYLTPLLFLVISLTVVTAALAAGGDASDPLASLSYLTGTFQSKVDSAVDQRLDTSDALLLQQTDAKLSGGSGGVPLTEVRLKSGDVLRGSTGMDCMLLAGTMKVTFSSGAVVDLTTGQEVSSGTSLTVRHKYLVAEDTSAAFTVTSQTAVVDYEGVASFTYSTATDYNAIASALKELNLFKGSYTGYGQGYDLEVSATRIQALIMFIRVLGEEDAALSWTGTTPFTDIAHGSLSEHYVGYALEKGYTNGYTATLFKPDLAVTANQYMEFMLRALGYSSAANTDLSNTLARALTAGVITSGEMSMLQTHTFLRAQLVYVSYYALDAALSGSSQTLRSKLLSAGVFTQADAVTADALVTSARL